MIKLAIFSSMIKRLLLIFVFTLISCQEEDPGLAELKDERPLDEQQQACEEWLNKANWVKDTNQYAQRFALYKSKAEQGLQYELLEIYLEKDTLRYAKGNQDVVKYQCPNVQWLKPNYQKFALMSSTYYEFFSQLQSIPLIKLITFGDQVNHPTIRSLVEIGVIQDLGTYENIDAEKMIQFLPDIVVDFQGVGSESKMMKKLRDLKVPILKTYAWKEAHPLGRAEWIKVMAWLVQRDKLAKEKFNQLKSDYTLLKQKAQEEFSLKDLKPKVIAADPYDGSWYVPANESYMGTMIQDAGANYLWDYPGDGSVKVQVEEAIEKALNAEIWINLSAWKSKSAIPSPYNKIKAVKNSALYHYQARQQNGGNDFYESGVFRVDLILRDLIRIFRNENEKLLYYQKLP